MPVLKTVLSLLKEGIADKAEQKRVGEFALRLLADAGLPGHDSKLSQDFRNWTRADREIPEKFVRASAVTLSALHLMSDGWEDSKHFEDREYVVEVLRAAHRVYAFLLGMEFHRIRNTCTLEPSRSGDTNTLDAVTETVFSYPKLTGEVDQLVYSIRNRTDVRGDWPDPDCVSVVPEGPGLKTLRSTLIQRTENSTTRCAAGSDEQNPERRDYLLVHEVEIDSATTDESRIVVRRRMPDAFCISMAAASPETESSGVSIARPTSHLELSLTFPEELRRLPVQIEAWGQLTREPAEGDSRVSDVLTPNKPKWKKDTGGYRWRSELPPVIGVAYGLVYRVEDADRQREKAARRRTDPTRGGQAEAEGNA